MAWLFLHYLYRAFEELFSDSRHYSTNGRIKNHAGTPVKGVGFQTDEHNSVDILNRWDSPSVAVW